MNIKGKAPNIIKASIPATLFTAWYLFVLLFQDEDNNVCYASLNVPTAAKTTKPMKGRTPTQNSNFSTYSEVRTHITHEL